MLSHGAGVITNLSLANCHVIYKLVENLKKKKISSMANISKMLYFILSYEIVIIYKEYSSIVFLFNNTAVTTLR